MLARRVIHTCTYSTEVSVALGLVPLGLGSYVLTAVLYLLQVLGGGIATSLSFWSILEPKAGMY